MLLPLLLSAAGFSACRVRIVFSFDYVLAKQRPEITNRVDVLIDIGNVEIRNVQLAVRGGTLSRFDIIAYRPAAQRIEVLVAGYIAVCAAHHEADQQLGSIRMLALADNVQGVDCRDTGGRLKVYRSEAPVVIFVLTQLGGSAEADRRVGLTLGTYSFRDLVRRRGEDGFVVMQTLEELIACVLAAVGQGQLFTVQLLVGSSQLRLHRNR